MEDWIPDAGASHHTTENMEGPFDVRVPPHGDENVIFGDDGTVLPVRAVGGLNLRFYMGHTDGADRTSFCVKLSNVYMLDGIKFKILLFISGTVQTGHYCDQSRHIVEEILDLALAVIAPGRRPSTVGKPQQTLDINYFHVSLYHVHETTLRATAAQWGITLTGQLAPCAGCVESKGRRPAIPHSSTRSPTVLGIIHPDLTGP
ncbi:unnamed protein product, partial [Sphacelaria rigidula]